MKYCKFLFIGFLILSLVGCDHIQINSEKDIPKSFCCNAKVSIDDKIYECSIVRQDQGLLQIDMISPDSVKNISFKWLGDKYEVSQKDLKCTKETNILPKFSFINEIKEILSCIVDNESIELKDKNEDINEYTGMYEKNKFNFLVDNNGSIQKIWSDDLGWSVQIFEFNTTNLENEST